MDNPPSDPAFVLRVLSAFDGDDRADKGELLWQIEKGTARFFAMCSDFFWWGGADAEEITPDNIGVLELAIADCYASDRVIGTCDAVSLFCARVRKMRPQGAAYKSLDRKAWPLFDACGPEREVGMGNPRKHPLTVE